MKPKVIITTLMMMIGGFFSSVSNWPRTGIFFWSGGG